MQRSGKMLSLRMRLVWLCRINKGASTPPRQPMLTQSNEMLHDGNTHPADRRLLKARMVRWHKSRSIRPTLHATGHDTNFNCNEVAIAFGCQQRKSAHGKARTCFQRASSVRLFRSSSTCGAGSWHASVVSYDQSCDDLFLSSLFPSGILLQVSYGEAERIA